MRCDEKKRFEVQGGRKRGGGRIKIAWEGGVALAALSWDWVVGWKRRSGGAEIRLDGMELRTAREGLLPRNFTIGFQLYLRSQPD